MQRGYSDADIASLREQVQRLQDEAEIRALIARLAQAGDAKDLETYVDQFAEDGVFEIVDQFRHEGIAQIRKGAEWRLANAAPGRHFVSGTVVEVDGDTARARSYWMLVVQGDGVPFVRYTGTYDDEFVRTPRGWKFKRRPVRFDPYPKLG